MIRLPGLAVACLLAAVARAEEPECGPLQRSPPFMRSVPAGTWSALEPTRQGVLIVGSSPWGTHVHAAGPHYAFVTGSSSPYFPYFWPDRPQPEGQLRPGEVASVGAVALLPSTPTPFGLERSAHLVEVMVNGGHGGLPQRELVISGMKQLDGTPAFPRRLNDVLDELHARYTRCLGKPQFNPGEAMTRGAERFARSKASRPPDRSGVSPVPDAGERGEDSLYVSWDQSRQTLAVVFSTIRSRSRCWQAERWVQPPGCPPGAPCLPGHSETITACGGYAVRTGYEFEVDAKRGVRPISFLAPAYEESEAFFPPGDPGASPGPARRK